MKRIFVLILTVFFLSCTTEPVKQREVTFEEKVPDYTIAGEFVFTYENWSYKEKDPNGNGEVWILYFDDMENLNSFISSRIKYPLATYKDEETNSREIYRLTLLYAALTFDNPEYSNGKTTNFEWCEVKKIEGEYTKYFARATHWNRAATPMQILDRREFFWMEPFTF